MPEAPEAAEVPEAPETPEAPGEQGDGLGTRRTRPPGAALPVARARDARPAPAGPRAEAEARLAEALRTGPFHVALQTALTARGPALHRVRHRLAQRGINVGVTSLSYWQRGIRRPDRPASLRAVTALEELLELPEHALTRLLGPRAAADQPTARTLRTLAGPDSAPERLLTELDVPRDGGLHTVLHHERVEIDGHRRLAVRESQHVVRAHRDGVDRYVAIHCGEADADTERVRVVGLENCRVGRVRRAQEAAVVVAELLFDARLTAGATAVLRYRFEDGTGEPSREYFRGFTHGGGSYVLQVAFDRAALPVRCRRFGRPSLQAPREFVADLTLNAYGTVHVLEPETRPGHVGVMWDWD